MAQATFNNGDALSVVRTTINSNANDAETRLTGMELDTTVIVRQASDFGVIDSTKVYLLDGIIDMGSTSIEIPAGGVSMKGFTLDVSKLTSSAAAYTMFTSPVGGSGNVLGIDYAIEVTGAGSQVYDLVGNTGNEAFEFSHINYNNCTSLGTIDTYRQGLESGTGRFGGTPELTLEGTWSGGYFIEASIVRGLTDGAYSLYKAGASFSMASRFRSNQNMDLNATVAFFDFAPANFTNPSTVQLEGCLVTRNGVQDATDTTLIPNMPKGSLVANFTGNIGLPNTFVGGLSTVSAESITGITSPNTFYDLKGTWTAADLQHFDSPANGQLRHLGTSPREYRLFADLSIDSGSNNQIAVKVKKWDDSASSFVDEFVQVRTVNSLSGSRDVAFFTIRIGLVLDQNDYAFLQVANVNTTTNATAEVGSFFTVEER